MNSTKHYAKRDPDAQGIHYINHVSAMTTEGLHIKSAIAAELAHRDSEIERLRAALAAPVQSDLIAIRKPTTRAEAEWLAKLAHLLVSDVNSTLKGLLATDSTAAPAQAGENEFVSRAGWVESAMRVYLIAGDTEKEARECAEHLWSEADMDDLPDPIGAAMEDCEGRGAARAAPVDAENEIDLFVEVGLCERLDACLAAARAVQKGSND